MHAEQRPIPEINRAFGFQVWNGLPATAGAFVDKYFTIKFYGCGHRWLRNFAIGFIVARPRSNSHAR